MKLLFFILVVLFLLFGCSKETQEQQISTEPLTISLNPEVIKSETPLKSEIQCITQGGKAPYKYEWSGKIDTTHCTNECSIIIKEIGQYNLECKVTDANNISIKKSIIITVEKQRKKIDAIIGLGDSLTYGYGLQNPDNSNWLYLYSQKFEHATLYNYAVSGSTTSDVKEKQLTSIKDIDKNKIIFLWIGVNDIVRFISLSQFAENYLFIINKLSTIENSTIILINIPDVSKLSIAGQVEEEINYLIEGFGIDIPVKAITKDIINRYNDAIYEIADNNNISVIDMSSYLETFDDDMITEDRFHPNEKGHKMIMQKIDGDVEKIFPYIEWY